MQVYQLRVHDQIGDIHHGSCGFFALHNAALVMSALALVNRARDGTATAAAGAAGGRRSRAGSSSAASSAAASAAGSGASFREVSACSTQSL